MNKTILIIGAGKMQIPIIKKAKELNLYVITIDVNKEAPGNKYADLALEIDTNDKEQILKVAKQYEINGILTTSDYPVRVVAYVCKQLGLSGLTETAAKICTDKYLLRNHLRKNNFLTPKYQLIENKKIDKSVIDYYPIIVKPVDSSASRGVSKVETPEELETAVKFANNYSKTDRVIVEEFIEGQEYSLETFTQNQKTTIVAITEKQTLGENNHFFVENRHIIPADLSKKIKTELTKTVENIINTLRIGDSATHTEVKINKKGIFVIEIGARLGGDFITSDLVPLSTGIDMLSNSIKISLGKPIDLNHRINKFSGVQFINTQNYYQVKSYIENYYEAISSFNIESFTNVKLENSLDRLGHFIVTSNNRKDLIQTLDCKY